MRIYFEPEAASYRFPGHPESPERVLKSKDHLLKSGYQLFPSDREVETADLHRVHSPEHLRNVREGRFDDADTPFCSEIGQAAILSVSAALSALHRALEGEPAFSLMRPPGHHAGKNRVAGFCYLNNMAISCAKALSLKKKVAVLDIDVHHGNGTEECAKDHEGWMYVSLHQNPLYPGTGLYSHGNCLNFPLPPGTGDREYRHILEIALKKITDFAPDVLGVSAGFDTFEKETLAGLKLSLPFYKEMGQRIAQTRLKRFALLEGGYAAELPLLIENFILGFREN